MNTTTTTNKWEVKTVNYWTAHYYKDAYKVIKYGKLWRGYFKPNKWTQFGNNVEDLPKNSDGDAGYNTFQEARSACMRHLERFGMYANENMRLKKG